MIGYRRRRINRALRALWPFPERLTGRILDVGGHRNRPLPPHLTVDSDPGVGADVCALAEALPFPPGSVDVVVCLETLQYVPAPRACLGEFRRVLRDGGVLVVSVPSVVAVRPPLTAFRLAAFGRLLGDAGFRVEGVRGLGTSRTRRVDAWIVRLGRWARLAWPLFAVLAATERSSGPASEIGWLIVARPRVQCLGQGGPGH